MEAKELMTQAIRHWGHRHGRSRLPRIPGLDGVHGEGSDGIDTRHIHALKYRGNREKLLQRSFTFLSCRRYGGVLYQGECCALSARLAQRTTTDRGPTRYVHSEVAGASCHGTMSLGAS